ncbi:hypothetical protein GCM10009836_01550 [Pseudonocardia ailaonensis]|uniref:ChsH2 C-terminal OB-fold domain-containing protein n=1 Tax=Pseudonocardia ailaonensis TaxID=367279 RepID=A0ABN2MID2_9PSEU
MTTGDTEGAGAADTAAPAPFASVDPTLYTFGPEGEVIIPGSQSDETGDRFWPPRLRCPRTGGTVTDVDLATTGTVWSWTFVHAPWPGLVSPNGTDEGYTAGLVDLADGPRVIGVLIGDREAIAVGTPVRAVPLPFRELADQQGAILAFETTGIAS